MSKPFSMNSFKSYRKEYKKEYALLDALANKRPKLYNSKNWRIG